MGFPCYSNYCAHVLPTVFEESLSYEEQVCKLIYAMQELENIVNNIQELNKEYVDEQIKDANAYTDEQIKEMRYNLTVQFDKKITEVYGYVNQLDEEQRGFILNEVTKLEKQIDDLILGDIKIFDPTVGYKRNIDTTINSIYNVLRVLGVSAGEYDSQHLTAKAYDALHLSARQYDVFARKYLFKDPNHYMNSPYTGQYITVQDVISQLVAQKKTNSLTAGIYDSLKLTAKEYDDKKVTAFDYDWNALGFFFSGNFFNENNLVINSKKTLMEIRDNTLILQTSPVNVNETFWYVDINTSDCIGKKIYVNILGISGSPSKLQIDDTMFNPHNLFIAANSVYTYTIIKNVTRVKFLNNIQTTGSPSQSITVSILIQN